MFCIQLNGRCRFRVFNRAAAMFIFAVTRISTILTFVLICNPASIYAAEVTPDQLEFRRQAVQRMIFDKSQDIRLSGLWPAKVVGLDVMHPPVGLQVMTRGWKSRAVACGSAPGKQQQRPAGSVDSILLRLMTWPLTNLTDRERSA